MGGELKNKAFGLLVAGALVIAGCSQGGEDPSSEEKVSKKDKNQVTEETSYEQIDPKEDEKILNNKVTYYETPKTETPAVHKEAENEIEKLAKDKKVNVKPDLKDGKFRDFVYSAASDIDSLSKEQQKKIADYVKYVDKYENQIKNKRIQELMKKVKDGKKLTGDERAELESLLPVKGGQKIEKTEPKKPEPDQPGQKTGGKDNDSKEEQEQGKKTGGKEQPGTTDGGSNQSGNDQEGNQESGVTGGDNEQPGTRTGGSDENGDDQEPGTDGGNDQDGNQGGNNVGNQSGMLIGGGGNDRGGENPPAGSYDPIKARDYAYKWWNKRNNEQYGYYSRVMGGCYDCWYDCTNFVSQAIKEGGIKEKRDSQNNLYWYYTDEKPSYAWGVANSLYKHLKDRKAEQVNDMFDLEVGDVVNVDFDHDGDIEHAAIVTKVTLTDVYVTQHTSDKKDSPLSSWFLAGYDVYGWKMQTVK